MKTRLILPVIYFILLLTIISCVYLFGQKKYSNEETLTKISCNKKFPTDADYSILKSYKISDKYEIILTKSISNKDVKAYRYDFCDDTYELIYAQDRSDMGVFLQGKYLVSFFGNEGYKENYNKVYFLDLSKATLNKEEPWKQVYKEADIKMSDNETFLHYNMVCGDGCDKDTRVFDFKQSDNKITVSVFDKNIKEIKKIENLNTNVNLKLREVEFVLP